MLVCEFYRLRGPLRERWVNIKLRQLGYISSSWVKIKLTNHFRKAALDELLHASNTFFQIAR